MAQTGVAKYSVEQWEGIDWNRTGPLIAREMNVSEATVYHWAKKLNKTMPGQKSEVDWLGQDWRGSSNAQIAKKTGRSRERVRQVRARLEELGQIAIRRAE